MATVAIGITTLPVDWLCWLSASSKTQENKMNVQVWPIKLKCVLRSWPQFRLAATGTRVSYSFTCQLTQETDTVLNLGIIEWRKKGWVNLRRFLSNILLKDIARWLEWSGRDISGPSNDETKDATQWSVAPQARFVHLLRLCFTKQRPNSGLSLVATPAVIQRILDLVEKQ